MATRYKHRGSSTPDAAPEPEDFEDREILVNTADARLFLRDEDGKVRQFLSAEENDDRYAAGDHAHSTATTSVSGFMSASDKTKLDDAVTSDDVTTIVVLTQAEYDGITSPDADTLYIIKD